MTHVTLLYWQYSKVVTKKHENQTERFKESNKLRRETKVMIIGGIKFVFVKHHQIIYRNNIWIHKRFYPNELQSDLSQSQLKQILKSHHIRS